MQPNLLMAIILPVFLACGGNTRPPLPATDTIDPTQGNPYPKIGSIPLPSGYHRLPVEPGSFGAWLRKFPLKGSRTVFLYNGTLKRNQAAAFAVLDISTGSKDLQQCADAVMRLRAEYLKEAGLWQAIAFYDNNGKAYTPPRAANRTAFDQYLERVFSYCGTLSLEKQLHKAPAGSQPEPGDVYIHGGSPGHAALVVDVAENDRGDRILLLMNSYMPAQDMHIVVNPTEKGINPWFSMTNKDYLQLPEWVFRVAERRCW